MGHNTGLDAPAIGWLTVLEPGLDATGAMSELELAKAYLAELQARRRREGFHIVKAPVGNEPLPEGHELLPAV